MNFTPVLFSKLQTEYKQACDIECKTVIWMNNMQNIIHSMSYHFIHMSNMSALVGINMGSCLFGQGESTKIRS